ncbi:hypothetical protein T03_6975 [Trichinella britovi]|uniref:Uncharacterized protein n=1 Tax=Trichinella britovi TaxID=45882 RepID=A0A0V0ZK06_TRIBR|nr:hypothetical protein T03_6975 [Trichinella britovi]
MSIVWQCGPTTIWNGKTDMMARKWMIAFRVEESS